MPEDGRKKRPRRKDLALTPPLEEEGKPRPKKLLDARYHRFETSGLEVTIEPRRNEVTLEVEPLPR